MDVRKGKTASLPSRDPHAPLTLRLRSGRASFPAGEPQCFVTIAKGPCRCRVLPDNAAWPPARQIQIKFPRLLKIGLYILFLCSIGAEFDSCRAARGVRP